MIDFIITKNFILVSTWTLIQVFSALPQLFFLDDTSLIQKISSSYNFLASSFPFCFSTNFWDIGSLSVENCTLLRGFLCIGYIFNFFCSYLTTLDSTYPDKYIKRNEKLVELFNYPCSDGRKIFLISNSK